MGDGFDLKQSQRYQEMSWHGARLAGSDAAINQVTVVYQVRADFGFLSVSYLGHYSFAFFFFFLCL